MIGALLRDGPTREEFNNSSVVFYAPRRLHQEVHRHARMIADRSGKTATEVASAVKHLFLLIEWVPNRALTAHWERAFHALAAADADDVPYLAAALAVDADAIWSHDRHFDCQSLVPRIDHLHQLV